MTFNYDVKGLRIVNDVDTLAVPWTDVVELAAVKQDTFNPTIIRLIVVTSDGEYEFDEADVGSYEEFMAVVGVHLPGSVPFEVWWREVTSPETRLQESLIYSRDAE